VPIPLTVDNQEYEQGEFNIDCRLRGSHEFLILAKNELKISFFKEDINSYPGIDILNISLRGLNGKLHGRYIVKDDGIMDSSKKTKRQKVAIDFEDLPKDLYTLSIEYMGSGSDTTINDLWINQKKVVMKHAFPTSVCEFEADDAMFTFRAIHKSALQNIETDNRTLNISEQSKRYKARASHVNIPKGDIQVSADKFFSVNGSLFNPYGHHFTHIDSINKSSPGVDYILLSYSIVDDGDWKLAKLRIRNKNLYYDEYLDVILNSDQVVAVDYMEVEFIG